MTATSTFAIVAILAVVLLDAASANAQTLRLHDFWGTARNQIDVRSLSIPDNPKPSPEWAVDGTSLFASSEPALPLSLPLQQLIDRLAEHIVPRLMHERDRLTVTLFDRYQVTPHFGLHAVGFTVGCKFDR